MCICTIYRLMCIINIIIGYDDLQASTIVMNQSPGGLIFSHFTQRQKSLYIRIPQTMYLLFILHVYILLHTVQL